MANFWQFRNGAEPNHAELILYGDIADTSWWGDEVTPKQFAAELNALGTVDEIRVRINSGGGDVFAAQTIGNLLEQHSATVTAHIDGLCASAATIIASHCDRVEAAQDSTYMIHPVKLGIHGYVDAPVLQQYLDALAAIKENIVNLYVRKTGREVSEITGWMDATSWWTAEQAKENGFIDELTNPNQDTVVENRNGILFVNQVNTNLPFEKVPQFMQNMKRVDNRTEKEELNMDITTVDGLRKAYPELVDQVEQAAAQRATCEERQRIRDIEEMTLFSDEELAAEAKFTNPVSASEYAKAALKHNKMREMAYLKEVERDAEESGVNTVGNAPVPQNENDVTATIAQARKDAADYLKSIGKGEQA